MKYLIIFLVSFNCFADYATKKDLLRCNSLTSDKGMDKRRLYKFKGRCESERGKDKCFEKKVGYNCKTIKYDPVKNEWGTDLAKKAAYDKLQSDKLKEKNTDKTKVDELKLLIPSLKSGTDLTPAQRRKLDLLIIRKLLNR